MKNGSSHSLSCPNRSMWPDNRPTGHSPKIGLFPYRPQTSVKRRDPADSNSMGALPIPYSRQLSPEFRIASDECSTANPGYLV